MTHWKNWFLHKQFPSEDKFHRFAFIFPFFSLPSFLFLCLLSKTTWANITSCHIKAIPCILQKREFCSWMEPQTSQTPSHRLLAGGVKTKGGKKAFSISARVCALRRNPLWNSEGSFPWNNRTNRRGWKAQGCKLHLLGYLRRKKCKNLCRGYYSPKWLHCHMIIICQIWMPCLSTIATV